MRHGEKHDVNKDDWSLIPFAELRDVVKVLGYGARKYARDNWQLVDDSKHRYFAALMRHLTDWYEKDEWLDRESRLPHLAHVACNALFLLHLTRDEK